MKGKKVFFFGIISLLCILWAFPAFAKEQYKLPISGKDYVLPEDSNFDYSEAPIVNSFFYGAGSMGTLYLYGAIEKGTVYNDSIAYGATGDLLFRYAYNGAFQTTEAESWHIEADGTRWIRDYDLGFLNNIASGCIMIEKSSDNRNWVKVIDPIKTISIKQNPQMNH